MRIDQLFEWGACFIGHTLWVGMLAAFTYWLLARTCRRFRPAAKVWIGLVLLLVVPFVAILVTVNGGYKIPLGHQVLISIPNELVSAVAVLWGFGMLFYIFRFASGIRQINLITAAGRVEPGSRFTYLIREFRSRFSISKRPQIELNSRVAAPFLSGVFSPRIVLPDAMRNADSNCLVCVMAHELAHFLRKDAWFLLMQKSLESIFFYHPALRWLSEEIRSEREKACDDLAVAMLGGNRMVYASALLETETLAKSNFPMALSFGGDSTADRASRIAFDKRTESARPGNVFLAILLFLTVVVGGWSVLSLVEVRFSLAESAPLGVDDSSDTTILSDPIPTFDITRIEAYWKDRLIEDRDVPVFRSVPLVEKGGKVFDLTKEAPRLFPEVPNKWLLQYRIDYLDGGMLSKDPDGDLFTNLEEYRAGTSPDSESSHPDRIELMSFHGLEYQAYRIQYRADPDSKTVQLTRMPTAQHRDRQNFYVKVGETTRDDRVRLEAISKQGIAIRDVKTGQLFNLKKKEIAEIRTNFAALKIRGGNVFHQEEGTSFYVPGDTSKKWKLSKVNAETCQLESPNGETKSFSRK